MEKVSFATERVRLYHRRRFAIYCIYTWGCRDVSFDKPIWLWCQGGHDSLTAYIEFAIYQSLIFDLMRLRCNQ